MTTPTIAPTKWSKTDTDYLVTKVRRDGSVQAEVGSVSVPSSTASGTVIGLFPFKKGFSLLQGASQIHIADLDTGTSFTNEIGFVYDDNVTYTNDPDAFAASNTTGQSAGVVALSAVAGTPWVAQADGWIAVTTGGGTTTTTGNITFQIAGTYNG